jgi:2-C-methyl-D-erythritol 4-phosphate cytidylyltransferase/2-C-methyl-D-erythritol 2,4-cyclodiphosphate synthase
MIALHMKPSKVAAIIPAAGSGIRMGLSSPKQFYELGGVPILVRTLRVFQHIEAIGHIIVVVPTESCPWVEDLVQSNHLTKVYRVIAGGQERQDSVLCGLEVLPDDVELVLVHDGVRPFVPVSVVEKCLQQAEKSGAAMAAIQVKDTLKAVSRQKMIKKTINRADVWQAQTPQVAKKSLLLEAYALAAEKEDFIATDEAGLLELLGCPVKVVEGSEKNIKITRKEDLILAKAILMESGQDGKDFAGSIHYRTGLGYDAHRLVNGRPLILGGEKIPYKKGLQGHSDADVLTHALCDAILGAAGAGDIGVHFPDSEQKFKDISSLKILESVVALVSEKGYALVNADITVVAQEPRLVPYFADMKKNLAAACAVDPDVINLKATTSEEMGFEGRCEGMSAHAVVMLARITHEHF